MTTPQPTPRTSPTAGFANALRRYYIQLAPGYIAALEASVATKQRDNRELTEAARTARDYADSKAAGYVTGLEA